MTKKRTERPNLGSTLKKKIELAKPEKEIESLEKQLTELHAEEKKPAPTKPTPNPNPAKKKAQEMVESEEMVRTTIFVPKHLYKAIKVYCAQQDDVKIKDFVTDSIVQKCKKLKLV